MVIAFAQNPKTTDCRSSSLLRDSRKKLKPMTPRITPITKVEINSARPWPYGCSLSGGFFDAFRPINTITEEKESESVCQASAIKPMDPATMPTQYLKMNNIAFTAMEIHPTRSEDKVALLFSLEMMINFKS